MYRFWRQQLELRGAWPERRWSKLVLKSAALALEGDGPRGDLPALTVLDLEVWTSADCLALKDVHLPTVVGPAPPSTSSWPAARSKRIGLDHQQRRRGGERRELDFPRRAAALRAVYALRRGQSAGRWQSCLVCQVIDVNISHKRCGYQSVCAALIKKIAPKQAFLFTADCVLCLATLIWNNKAKTNHRWCPPMMVPIQWEVAKTFS